VRRPPSLGRLGKAAVELGRSKLRINATFPLVWRSREKPLSATLINQVLRAGDTNQSFTITHHWPLHATKVLKTLHSETQLATQIHHRSTTLLVRQLINRHARTFEMQDMRSNSRAAVESHPPVLRLDVVPVFNRPQWNPPSQKGALAPVLVQAKTRDMPSESKTPAVQNAETVRHWPQPVRFTVPPFEPVDRQIEPARNIMRRKLNPIRAEAVPAREETSSAMPIPHLFRRVTPRALPLARIQPARSVTARVPYLPAPITAQDAVTATPLPPKRKLVTIWRDATDPKLIENFGARSPANHSQAWPAEVASTSPLSPMVSAAQPLAPAPDMNRVVDEVMRRVERVSRDERLRRGH
jgi:hypothetical protein